MVTLNTLDSLIDDILEEARNNNVSESESITRIQLEQWIHQYRALLIKQDLDKGRYTNPSYIQSYDTAINDFDAGIDNRVYYSTPIPNTIDLHFKSGITGIIFHDRELQLMPSSRVSHQLNKKYSSKEPIAFLKNNILTISVIDTADLLSYDTVTISGIFEDPSQVDGFLSSNVYPIPANMIPTLKQLIFEKEFKVTLNFPTDDKNNSNNELRTTPQQK
jgi:hypothetical protein